MRVVISSGRTLECLSYRLKSQVHTLFEPLGQCGRDQRFNSPFCVCQNILSKLIYQAKVLRQTVIEDKEGELCIERRDSYQMKDIRVP
jgi:hypothetical protein